eukprot:TRINITY_DN17256_c0_g1_i1.p1 TRINITY_DN17256_c0_g1~~TRINITY_DN17256_c0_g1_i1.p1  ORF type:complete len:537 (+),score=125.66 TRINITY_DN17256_c0_g1_i1:130-1740(+)
MALQCLPARCARSRDHGGSLVGRAASRNEFQEASRAAPSPFLKEVPWKLEDSPSSGLSFERALDRAVAAHTQELQQVREEQQQTEAGLREEIERLQAALSVKLGEALDAVDESPWLSSVAQALRHELADREDAVLALSRTSSRRAPGTGAAENAYRLDFEALVSQLQKVAESSLSRGDGKAPFSGQVAESDLSRGDGKAPLASLPEEQVLTADGSEAPPAEAQLHPCSGSGKSLEEEAAAVEELPEVLQWTATPSTGRSRGHRPALLPILDIVSAAAVILNALLDGCEAEALARGSQSTEVPFSALGYGFSVYFVVELLLRIAFSPAAFFRGLRGWNLVDMCFVLLAVTELSIQGVAEGAHGGLRALKMCLVLRGIRILRFCGPLSDTAAMLLRCFRASFWALSMLGVLIYVVAVALTLNTALQLVERGDSVRPSDLLEVDALHKRLGSLLRSVCTLIQTSLGDPALLGDALLASEDVPALILWLFYVVLSAMALLNIVTAMFVQIIIESASTRQEEIVDVHFNRILSSEGQRGVE